MENYIEDTLAQLIEEANELKTNKKDEFELGKLFGLHRAITIVLNQAESFGVSDKLPPILRDFNPEELITKNKTC